MAGPGPSPQLATESKPKQYYICLPALFYFLAVGAPDLGTCCGYKMPMFLAYPGCFPLVRNFFLFARLKLT